MSKKRKGSKDGIRARRDARRRAKLLNEQSVLDGLGPRQRKLAAEGRLVIADPSQQAPNNSYSPPPRFYVDTPFTCVDCGADEVWAADDQKWYYEVVKAPLYATAIRCRSCRKKLQHAKEVQRQQMDEADRLRGDGSR